MREQLHHDALSAPARGLGEGWCGRVRRYMWAEEDPRSGVDADGVQRPATPPSPRERGEGENPSGE